jgi:hypothetical protein
MRSFRLGKADRATHQPLDSRPQIDMLAFDFLCARSAHRVLLRIDMPLVGPPPVRVKRRDAKRLQQLLQPQEDVVLIRDTPRERPLVGAQITRLPRNTPPAAP